MMLSMRTIVLIIAAAILVVGGIVLFFVSGSPKQSPAAGQPPASLPTAGSINTGSVGGNGAVPQMSVLDATGNAISTKDFIHNGETIADTQNPGSYVLAGSLSYCRADGSCPQAASTTDFSVTYYEPDNSFNVVLLTEPLGAVREEAEQFLEDRLGIPAGSVCALRYSVSVTYQVNQSYTGRNLGFSNCPNAVILPQ